jgi:hypothetical protein
MHIDFNPPKNNYNLSVQNFRVFKETQLFNFAPLTLLIGPNSSGKSSVVKLLSIFNFSANKYKELSAYAPLKLDGNFLPNDFIDLSSSISDFNAPLVLEFQDSRSVFFKDFSYEFEFLSDQKHSALGIGKFTIKINQQEAISIKKTNYENSNDNSFDILMNIEILLEELKSFAKRMENDSIYPVTHYKATSVFDLLKNNDDLFVWKNSLGNSLYSNKLRDFQDEYFNKTIKINIDNLPEHLIINQNPALIDNGLKGYVQGIFVFLQNAIQNELIKQKIFDEIEFSEIGNYLSNEYILNISNSVYKSIFEQTNFIKSSVYRSKRNRYFVLNENINSSFEISLNKYISESITFIEENTIYGCDYVDCWLKKFNIGESLEIIAIDKSNTIFLVEIVKIDGKRVNIADLGYGSGQIISLILVPFLHLEFYVTIGSFDIKDLGNFKLNEKNDSENSSKKSNSIKWEINSSVHIHYLEEPETNLHPNWQSLIAELFSFHLTLGIRYIIETHSEYLVRNLQKLVAQKKLHNDDVSIHYFNCDEFVDELNGEPKVKNIQMNEMGGLTDNFGPGFFDEAHNLKFDLLRINKQQLN